jgi:hypothetical protein
LERIDRTVTHTLVNEARTRRFLHTAKPLANQSWNAPGAVDT